MHLNDIEQLKKVFENIDVDKSGTIDTTELRAALEKAGKKPTDAEVKTVIEKYASDKSWCAPLRPLNSLGAALLRHAAPPLAVCPLTSSRR